MATGNNGPHVGHLHEEWSVTLVLSLEGRYTIMVDIAGNATITTSLP